MYQMDAQHTGRSPFAGPRQARVARTFDTSLPEYRPQDPLVPPADIQSSSVVGADGTIYIGNLPGYLFALRDSSSASDKLDLAWKFRPPNGSSLHATPALASDGTVYIPFTTGPAASAKTTLFALRGPTSGQDPQIVWQADLGAGVVPAETSPTLGPDGTIYIVTATGVLSAVGADGKLKWTAQTATGTAQFGQAVKVAPALGPDGTVYTTTLTGKLWAVGPPSGTGDQGRIKWSFDFAEHLGPTELVSAPVTAPPNRGQDGIGSAASATIGPDGTIYVGANNSNVYAVDPGGEQKWLYEAERELAGIWTTGALSPDSSTLYIAANKGGVYALNTSDGTLKWQYPIFASVYSSPVLDIQGTLYIGSTAGHVFAIDTARAERVFDYDAHTPVWTAPSIRPDRTLVVGDRAGHILVLGDQA
ncbi:MAG: PQQ-binding-like beta-propeller repeat protein [Chloroflexota bacterium]